MQIDCIVFDKDGTLVDLHLLWGSLVERWTGKLVQTVVDEVGGNSAEITNAIYKTLGYDAANGKVIADSPLAVATIDQITLLNAVVLHQQGVDWHKAEHLSSEVLLDPAVILPTLEMIRPIYEPEFLQTLHAAGIQLAVLTADNRAPTEETLRLLKIDHLFSAVGCADDPNPSKPDPSGIYRIAEICGTTPDRMIMVGDSRGDMATGINASVAASIGIGTQAQLGAVATVVMPTIDGILDMMP